MFLQNELICRFSGTLALAGGLLLAGRGLADEALVGKLDPFLSEHCYECHDDLTSEGDLDLTALSLDFTDPASFGAWEQVFDRVESGDMPPVKKPRPDAGAMETFLEHLKRPLIEIDRADVEAFGRVHGRRLTRTEYEYSLHDLLGIDIPLTDMLPAEDGGHGFETEADVQQLSHFHLEKYLAAADAALDEAFGRAGKGDATWKKTLRAKELTARSSGNYRGPDARDGKTIVWKHGLQFTGRMPKTAVPASGWYRITLANVQGINPGADGVVWGSLRSGACYSNEPMLYYVGSVEAGKKPSTVSFDAWMQGRHMLEFKPAEALDKSAPTGATGGNVSYKNRDLAAQGFAGISFDSITLERIYPNATRWQVRQNLVPGVKFDKGKPVIEEPEKELRRLVTGFAGRAFRRPASPEQVEPYVQLATVNYRETNDLADALRVGYRAVLCSPRFLTFVESPGELDDYAVASRLSYFLWSSLPDQELLQLAKKGQLRDRKVLAGQVNRLLEDPKSARFIASFTDQWLELKKIDFTTPDPRRFREFDVVLQDSMVQETRGFFAELVRGDLGVSRLLHSDFAMLNTRLKTHYRLADVAVKPGEGLQKVSLPSARPGRSGLVTQASILKVTADGSVTSPILRGIWINERILGLETPPPPPNVPAVEPDIRGATSIRDQLAKHSSDEACAACHAKIDPAGFALENYDPIGSWRTAYGKGENAAKVDPSGITPEGEPFQGIGSWKAIYAEQPELLARALAKHLLAYSTGAPTRFSDEEALDAIVAEAGKKGYGVRSLIQASVASRVFRHK